MDEYCYVLTLRSLPQYSCELDEIYSACEDISKKLNKLICKIKTDKLPGIEFILDTLESLSEQLNDCCDNENYIEYFNEILNNIYEACDTLITTADNEELKFIQIEFI